MSLGVDPDAVRRHIDAINARVVLARRERYVRVFAKHVYQGGWGKTGRVKCLCGWSRVVTMTQPRQEIAEEAFARWAEHLAEVVIPNDG